MSLYRILAGLFLLACTTIVSAKTLTVYTYDAFAADWGPGPKIKEAFEKKCDCTLKLVALDSSVGILNRVLMEGKQSHADVVMGLDLNLLNRAEKSGLFAPHEQDNNLLELPVKWQNSTFLPFDYGYFAFIYDKTKLQKPPRSMDELINSDLKVIYQDPRTSTPGLGLLLWLHALYQDKADEAFQQLARHTVTVTRSWSEAYGLFLQGEADMVLSYTSSPAYHLLNDHNDNYQAALFKKGQYLQVEVAARLKSSKEPELAKQFMAFILSHDFQQTIPTGNWMYPARESVVKMPKGFPNPPATTPLQIAPETIAKMQKQWIRAWLKAVS